MEGAIYSLVVIVMLVVFLIMSYQFFRNIEKSNILYLGPGNEKLNLSGQNLQPSVYANEYTFSTFVYISSSSYDINEEIAIYKKGDMKAVLDSKLNTLTINDDNKVENIPIGRWFHLAVVVRDMATDVFIDSKLKRHYIYKTRDIIKDLDVSNKILINPSGEIDIAKFQYFSSALSSSQVRDIYDEGPTPGITDSFSQMLKDILVETEYKNMEDIAKIKCGLVK